MSVDTEALVGPAAGIVTSVLWTATSIFFTSASRRLGPTVVNGVRLALAVVLLGVTLRVLDGMWWPTMSAAQWWYLGVSGVVGLTICDQFLFTAFVDIGPRRVMLLMTTSPLFGLGFGAAFLDERVGALAILGMGLTLGGVLWVLLDRRGRARPGMAQRHLARGVAFSVLGAALQAAGALMAKCGMGHGELPSVEHVDPLAATYVRMVFGMLGAVPLLAWMHLRRRGKLPDREPGARRTGLIFVSLGAIFGPYLGVWASVVAFDRSPLGVAQTLCALPPVFILPLVGWLYGEHVGVRGQLGALLAVGGAALLFVA